MTEMKPENIIALAEATGWERQTREMIWWNKQLGKYATLPELRERFNDLNACAEMEKTLTTYEAITFRLLLSGNSGQRNAEYLSAEAAMCHATAAQRAEAFLKAKNIWKD